MKKIFLILILSLFTTNSFADGHANANGFSITLKVPMADAAKVEEILMKHAKWIKETHPLTGEKKLNSYSIMKGPQWKNPGDPSQGTTGNIFYVLNEVDEQTAGFGNEQEGG